MQRLNALANDYKLPCTPCETLTHAVTTIDRHHTEDSLALLSPAAASLDQFPSYAARGEAFKQAVLYLSVTKGS